LDFYDLLARLLLGVLGQSTAVHVDLADPGPFRAGRQIVSLAVSRN
jgi:hypothetical protein